MICNFTLAENMSFICRTPKACTSATIYLTKMVIFANFKKGIIENHQYLQSFKDLCDQI